MSGSPLAGRRILIVDDDPDILEGMALSFRGVGAVVETRSDGEAAWQAMMDSQPELVVLDMMLPRASGLLLLDRLQEFARRPPIIMVTANQGRRHQAYAKALGVEGYLIKPVPLERLLDLAGSLLAPPSAAD